MIDPSRGSVDQTHIADAHGWHTASGIPTPGSYAALYVDFNTAFVARCAFGQIRQQVGDVIPRMPVQPSPQAFLIQEVRDQTDTPPQDKQTVEHSHVEIIFGFFRRESTAISEEINEADGDAAVNVEDQIVLFGRGHGLNCDGVIEKFGAGKVFVDEIFNQFNAEVGVLARFDAVADTGDLEKIR